MVLSKVNVEVSISFDIEIEMFMIKDLRKALKWVPGRRILK